MAKIPYLFRRKNIYYFRFSVPAELRSSLKVREIIKSLKTENRAEAIPLALKLASDVTATLHGLKTGKKYEITHLDLLIQASNSDNKDTGTHHLDKALPVSLPPPSPQPQPSTPKLSVIVADFLNRYDPANKAMLRKLTTTLPIFVDLIGNKFITEILQADVNGFFDEVQKLPVRRDTKEFKGMSLKQIITANTGACIAEKTFTDTYRACVSVFIEWTRIHYKDQGFPDLSTKGATYRGTRSAGINKQRALKIDELRKLFEHPKIQKYAANSKTAHYCWLPMVGLHTGARINEICQLNPFTDIVQDKETGVYYFHFTDKGETADGVNKSIKTKSSRRIVPIHSKLLELGFLDYIKSVKRDNHKIIFPEWEPRNGKASANAGKWFARYLNDIGVRDETEGVRLTGFHSFRHTFITWGMTNKIQGIFAITGHETEVVDGFGKISSVAKGYWSREITDNILEKQTTIEKFDYGLRFYRPSP